MTTFQNYTILSRNFLEEQEAGLLSAQVISSVVWVSSELFEEDNDTVATMFPSKIVVFSFALPP